MSATMDHDIHVVQSKFAPKSQFKLTYNLGQYLKKVLQMCSKQNSVAVIDASTGQFLTYHELFEKVNTVTNWLRSKGYNRDVIAVCSENRLELIIVIFAVLFSGSPLTMLNPEYTENELNHCLRISQPKLLITSDSVQLKSSQLFDTISLADIAQIIRIQSNANTTITDSSTEVPPENVAFIIYSSGTTGLPKGVMLTHANLLSTFHWVNNTLSSETNAPINNDVVAIVLPLYHMFGLGRALFHLGTAGCILLHRRFNVEAFVSTIPRYRVTSLILVPTIIEVLLQNVSVLRRYDLSSVHTIVTSAASLNVDSQRRLSELLPYAHIQQMYGSTETLGVFKFGDHPVKPGSSGLCTPLVRAKIRDPNSGRSLPMNQIGELCLKGPQIMKGYCRDEEATRHCFTKDGWFTTGDLAYYDEDEYFFIVDRLKDIIKYKGFQISPVEIEMILLTHPGISDVAIVGKLERVAGEVPVAYIVRAPKSNITAQDVNIFLKGKIAPYKYLRGGVVFVDEIPRNSTGKILRRQLREQLIKELSEDHHSKL